MEKVREGKSQIGARYFSSFPSTCNSSPHMFIFIIITLFCTVNWTSCQAPLLVFPSNVDIPYSTGTANIAFSLAKAPKDDVTMFIEVKNVFFDNCNIQFEKGSWNVPQTVLATTLPYFTESDKVRSIPMRMKLFSENDPEFDQKEYILSITRSGAAGRICTIGGDPHFLVRTLSNLPDH